MVEPGNVLFVMDVYDRFLRDLDTWFRSIRVKYGTRMQCGRGCTLCCHGLFDIPLPDALRVAAGFQGLAQSVHKDVQRHCELLHFELLQAVPKLKGPFFLKDISEDMIDRLVDRFDEMPCPFLGNGDECLIYEFRPLACILEGVPMVDARDGPFDDWCTLNFAGGMDKDVETDLVLDYYGIEAMIQSTEEILAGLIPDFPQDRTTVFLPSVVVAFETYWERLLK
jgi:Fe-S-cluster containining protein